MLMITVNLFFCEFPTRPSLPENLVAVVCERLYGHNGLYYSRGMWCICNVRHNSNTTDHQSISVMMDDFMAVRPVLWPPHRRRPNSYPLPAAVSTSLLLSNSNLCFKLYLYANNFQNSYIKLIDKPGLSIEL